MAALERGLKVPHQMQGLVRAVLTSTVLTHVPGPPEAEFGSRVFNLSLKLNLIPAPGAEFPNVLPLPPLELGGREGDGEGEMEQ